MMTETDWFDNFDPLLGAWSLWSIWNQAEQVDNAEQVVERVLRSNNAREVELIPSINQSIYI